MSAFMALGAAAEAFFMSSLGCIVISFHIGPPFTAAARKR
jgi:hypothetical protein